jgi:3-dehydroquinate synthetase
MESIEESSKVTQLVSAKPARPASEHPLYIGHDWYDAIVDKLVEVVGDHMVAVVIDEEVARLYPERLTTLRQALPRVRVLSIKGGENAKTLDGFAAVLHFLIENEVHRDDVLLSIGGGAIIDLAGLAAGTYVRGLRWINIPTTFMSQFDSSVGGKNAINVSNNKNICGSFYEAAAVFIDTSFLDTLPNRFFRGGVSEMTGLALIDNEPLLAELLEASGGGRGLAGIQAELLSYMVRAINVKLKVYSSDPYQQGLRMVLLTGHTTAHALEGASRMHLYHGEAVAIGLAFESFIAERRGLIKPEDRKRLIDVLENCQLPVALPAELHDHVIIEHIRLEKRNRGRMVSMVLPYNPGKAIDEWPGPHVMLSLDELWDLLAAYRIARG